MIYFLNTEIPNKKIIFIALQHIFGIGKNKSIEICNYFSITKKTSIIKLALPIKNQIVVYIEKNININDDLKQSRIITGDIILNKKI